MSLVDGEEMEASMRDDNAQRRWSLEGNGSGLVPCSGAGRAHGVGAWPWTLSSLSPLRIARPSSCTEQHCAAISTCITSIRPPPPPLAVLWSPPAVAAVHSDRPAHILARVAPAPCSCRPPCRPLRFSMRQEPRPVPYMRDDQ